MTLENDNGGSDKWELEDSSARAAITSINGSKTSAFNVLKIKVEDDANNDTFNSVVPFADSTITIANWNKKKEFQLKFETGGEEVELKGDLTAFVVPVPAAVWLFGSGLGLLGWMRRKA